MSRLLNRVGVSVVCALAAGAAIATGVPVRLGAFTFDYLLAGEGVARPLQVFDDGVRTYLQYRAGVPMPAFVSADGQQLFTPRLQGPYLVLDAVPRDLVAQLGGSRVRITHANLATNAVQWSADGRTVRPDRIAGERTANGWTDHSYATPSRGDRIEWRQRDEVTHDFTLAFPAGSNTLSAPIAKVLRARAPALASATRIQVLGRDDGTFTDGLAAARAVAVADQLVAAGVPRARIAVQVAREARDAAATGEVAGVTVSAFMARPHAPPPERAAATVAAAAPAPAPGASSAAAPAAAPRFQLRSSDATLAANLQRWASLHGWRVVVQDAPEVKVVADVDLRQPDFLAAADSVITQAREAGYAIGAAAYGNRVLVLMREDAK